MLSGRPKSAQNAAQYPHAENRNDSQETIQAPDEPGAYSMCCDAERNHAEVKSGAEGIRTLDLSIANATLSQLSYRPDSVHSRGI